MVSKTRALATFLSERNFELQRVWTQWRTPGGRKAQRPGLPSAVPVAGDSVAVAESPGRGRGRPSWRQLAGQEAGGIFK